MRPIQSIPVIHLLCTVGRPRGGCTTCNIHSYCEGEIFSTVLQHPWGAQRGDLTCFESHSYRAEKPHSHPGSSDTNAQDPGHYSIQTVSGWEKCPQIPSPHCLFHQIRMWSCFGVNVSLFLPSAQSFLGPASSHTCSQGVGTDSSPRGSCRCKVLC